jgi:hypothetical protein
MFDFLKRKEKMPQVIIADCNTNCGGEKCPKWMVLEQSVKIEPSGEIKKTPVGHCCEVWKVIMMIELRQTIEKATKNKGNILIPK